MKYFSLVIASALTLTASVPHAGAAQYMEKNDFQKQFAFSPAVISRGGRVVWLSGVTALRDESGRDISGQFEPQARMIFGEIDRQLKKAGGSLANLVSMTVYAADPKIVPRFVQVRKALFRDGNFPGSTFIQAQGFALPGIVLEIQGIAVIGDECSQASPCSPASQ